MSNNNVKEWVEFQKLGELQNLEDLVFVGKSKSWHKTGYIAKDQSVSIYVHANLVPHCE